MNKKILIISSNLTGHGHKSITESLLASFSKIDGVTVKVVDGFELGGNLGVRIGKLYGSITRTAKDLWKVVWDMSMKRPKLVNEFTAAMVKEKFLHLLKEEKPDLILSVHPNFVGSVLDILDEEGIDLPFVTLLADLVSISTLWMDPRADYTICPTTESQLVCLEHGIPMRKTKIIKFPVRENFRLRGNDHVGKENPGDGPITFLIMSGGEGVGNMSLIAKKLLNNFDCRVKILAGRNKLLKSRLEKNVSMKYPGRVDVYGFTDKVHEIMRECDIAVTRGSPNVIMEAVNSGLPLIITGALPGQEAQNPYYVEKYNLGVICNSVTKLVPTVKELIADNFRKLNEIRQSQMRYRDPDASDKIVNFLLQVIEEKEKNRQEAEYKSAEVLDESTRMKSLGKLRKVRIRIPVKLKK